MRQFLMVVAFTLLTVGLFAGYSNYGIPQIEPAPPPKQEKIDLGAMTMDKFIALGEKIFNGKGTCTLCHNNLGRAPMLDGAAGLVPKRLTDPRYKGEATNVEEYLIESFIKPSAFVVAGFGKKGTNDSESPMPDVSGGSIRLSDAEIKAVVAYLQDTGGAEVTVKIPTDAPEQVEQTEDEPRAPFETPEQAIAELGCGACHKVATEEGEVGPDLRKIGGLRDKAYLRQAILDPNADIPEGFEKDQMPPDYGTQMYAQELEMMVDYLAGLK
ncbi:MAG: c-type cytochrome [Alphaproteobacteria bacterium]|jgi:mono/diheme cytochrome c family protein|nr:c-type cytochrome [Alphaproteobacteria bacterium]